jgi:hypothetical protein
MLFKFKRSKQCPHKATLKESWIIVEEVRCERDAEHLGQHVATTRTGAQIRWMTQDKIQRLAEERGRNL